MLRRRADLKTGTTCNSNCVFCVIGDHLFTGDRSTEDCIAELQSSRATCVDVVFTGAEVSIRPDFLQLVRAAKRLGYERIQIQTNGRMFAYREFCERTIAAGANEFSPSIHGHIATLHDGLTRAPGSFVQIVRAIEHLVALGQPVVTNTVITKQNARHLPELARMLIGLGVAQYQLAFPHPTGHAATYFRGVVPRMSEIAGFVHEALALGRGAGVSCMAEAMPFCMMPGYEREVSELHIPPTEIVYDGYVVPDYGADRMARGKTRFEACASCRFEPICEGPWREYPAGMGEAEFVPVPGSKVIDPQLVLDGRFVQLGTLAPRLPDDAEGWRAVCFVPQAGSPGCTAQLCSMVVQRDLLAARGIALVVLSPDHAEVQSRWAAQHGASVRLVPDVDREHARRWAALDQGRAVRRSSYLVDPEGRIAHVVVEVDTAAHGRQLADAFDRLHAPARPRGRAPERATLRRRAADGAA
ncbi:MAG: radical SAM protein [Deltaproteobacteria bacterium]|nr:radical SAM protein [Nannocystaceae bacterium]